MDSNQCTTNHCLLTMVFTTGLPLQTLLIGGFNPLEKYDSQIGSSSQLLGKIKKKFQTTSQIINHY